jgi:hypothetical protein
MAGSISSSNAFWWKPWRMALWGGALGLLCLPAIAMQVTDEVVWTIGDFLVFGLMLSVVVGALEFIASRRFNLGYKPFFAALVLAGFALVWAELAVGIFS